MVFDPDKVEPRWGRAARAITLGHRFHGVIIYESGGVQQDVDLPKGPWQIAVGSCGYGSLAMGRWLLVKWLPFINLRAAGSS